MREAHEPVLRENLYRMCRRRAPPNYTWADWIEELRAEASCAACAARESYDPLRGVPLPAFLHYKVLTAVLTRYRQECRYASRFVSESGELAAVPSREADVETQGWLAKALGSLPATDRQLIQKLFWAGQTESEVAQVLRISQQAVSARKRAILRRLRCAFSDPGLRPEQAMLH